MTTREMNSEVAQRIQAAAAVLKEAMDESVYKAFVHSTGNVRDCEIEQDNIDPEVADRNLAERYEWQAANFPAGENISICGHVGIGKNHRVIDGVLRQLRQSGLPFAVTVQSSKR